VLPNVEYTSSYYYLADDGGLYNDEGLCDLWKAAVTPTPTPTPVTPGGWMAGLYGQGGSAGKRRKSKRYAIRTFGVLDLLGAPKESKPKRIKQRIFNIINKGD